MESFTWDVNLLLVISHFFFFLQNKAQVKIFYYFQDEKSNI